MDVKKAIEILKENGYKCTTQRKIMLEVICEQNRPYKANEIFNMVSEITPGINFSTIYRNLELLLELGIINKISLDESFNYYEVSTGKHRHHIICKICGNVKEIDLCPFKEMEKSKLEELGFEPQDHKFEIYGLCSKCKNRVTE